MSNAGIQIPAVIIELPAYLLNIVESHRLHVFETDDDIGDLDPRIINVIFDFDLFAQAFEQPDNRITQNGIPQMTNMSRLVRIYAGVFDNYLFSTRVRY